MSDSTVHQGQRLLGVRAFSQIVESTLTVEYAAGGVTPVIRGQSTGWRVLPWLVTARATNGAARLEYRAGASYAFADGDACCIAPGALHRIEFTGGQAPVSLWSHTTITLFDTVPLNALLEIPSVFTGSEAARIGELNADLAAIAELPQLSVADLFRRKALGLELGSCLAACSAVRAEGAELLVHAEHMAPVLTYIKEHLAEEITREKLASQVSLSSSRFYAVFRAAFGVGPSAYLQNLRMRRAQQLLITTSLSVQEIAAQSGFPDAFHFSRLFKKRTGLSPSHYRERVPAGLL